MPMDDRSAGPHVPDPDPSQDAEAAAAFATDEAQDEASPGDPAERDAPDGMAGGEDAADGHGPAEDVDTDALGTELQDMLGNEKAAGDHDARPDAVASDDAGARLRDSGRLDAPDTAWPDDDARPNPTSQDAAELASSGHAGTAAPDDGSHSGDASPDAAHSADPGDRASDSPDRDELHEMPAAETAALADDGSAGSPGRLDTDVPDAELSGGVAPAASGSDTGAAMEPAAPDAEAAESSAGADDPAQELPDAPGGDGWRPETRLFDWDTDDAGRAEDDLAGTSAEFESDTGDANWPDDGARRAVLDLAAVREAAADSMRETDPEAPVDPDSTGTAPRGFTPHFSRRPADYETVTPPAEDVDGDAPPDAEDSAGSAGGTEDAGAGTDAAEGPTGGPDRTFAAETDGIDPSGAAAGSEIGGGADDLLETAGDGGEPALHDLPAAEAVPGGSHLAEDLADDGNAAATAAGDGDAERPAQSVFEPETGATDDAPRSTIEGRPTDEVADGAIDAAVSDEIRNLRARLAGAVGSDVDPSLGDAAADAPDAPGASDFAIDEEGFIDEDALRRIVAEVVREELQGALGERITRNVRKLVRREIRLVLAADELD
jgi:hypothetical protein